MNTSDTDEVSPEEVFERLGHETRLAILYALWEDDDRSEYHPYPGSPVSFTTLRKRVGMRDGGQFNYHLGKLVGPFVHATEEGYVLRRRGVQVISAVLAGGLTEEVVLAGEPVSEPCPLCGGQVVLEHGTEQTLDWLVSRCTDCEGGWKMEGVPEGVLMLVDPLEPAGIHHRSPDDMYRALMTKTAHEFTLVTEGVCPSCSGPVSATPAICEEHATEPGRVCERCETIFEVRFNCACEVCDQRWRSASDRHFVTHPTVHAFLFDHGYDPLGHDWLRIQAETIAEQSVVSEDPLWIRTVLAIDDDRLVVTLDDEGGVVDVDTNPPSGA